MEGTMLEGNMRFNERTGRYLDDAASEDAKTYSMFTHLMGLLSLVDISGVLVFIGTLIMWQVRKKDSEFIDDHGREAVNFQISLFILAMIGVLAAVIFTVITFGVGAVIVAPLAIVGAIFLVVLRLIGCIRGAIAAQRGEIFRYPMCIRCIPAPMD